MNSTNISTTIAPMNSTNISTTIAPVRNAAQDQFFLLVMGIVVYLMQGGFAFLEAGSVRSKNTTNILIKNVLDSFIGAVSYYLFGYALAFGESGNSFCGTTNWALSGVPHSGLARWFFQFVFAATASTIVSGAIAERCEFVTYLIYSVLITGFIYPIGAHWVWHPQGWLRKGFMSPVGQINYLDFSGSGAVHVIGGTAALVSSAVIGPRIGVQQPGSRRVKPIKGHSVPLVALGGFVVLFGFFAFNGGSHGAISTPDDADAVSLAMVNTIICASVAAFTALALDKVIGKRWSLLETINGALAGGVAICAAGDVVEPWGACVIGAVAGMVYFSWSRICLRAGLDDPINAVAVHLGGGAWGVVSVGLMDPKTGVFYNWNAVSGYQIAWQFTGLFAIIGWATVTCLILFGTLKAIGILRVDRDTELKGLDWPKHGEIAYPMRAYGHGWEEDEPDQTMIFGKFPEFNGETSLCYRSGHLPKSMGAREGVLNHGANLKDEANSTKQGEATDTIEMQDEAGARAAGVAKPAAGDQEEEEEATVTPF